MKASLGQYRLRKAAIEMQSFTVTELMSATGMNRESVQVFLHRLEKKGSLTLTKENLPTREPGRPIVRYLLTTEGIEILMSENMPVVRELNESILSDFPDTVTTSARLMKIRTFRRTTNRRLAERAGSRQRRCCVRSRAAAAIRRGAVPVDIAWSRSVIPLRRTDCGQRR